jgi:hypothetical protein
VTQSDVEIVQDPELSKNDRPLRVAVEALDLAVFELEHVAARGVIVHELLLSQQSGSFNFSAVWQLRRNTFAVPSNHGSLSKKR